jgi:quinolinate synthase
MLITECSMSDNVCSEFPATEFVRPCNLCPHMQRVTLANIRDCLESLAPEITIPRELAVSARKSVQRMFEIDRRRA